MANPQYAADYEQIHTPRAFEEVAAQIRRRVIHGQLRPGDRLPAERDLAVRLGVSRNTVREALRGLEMAGVLRLQKGVQGGAFVVTPNGDTVGIALQDMFQLGSVTPEQLTEVRLHMTGIVVRIVCGRLSEEVLQGLDQSVDAAIAATLAGDFSTRSTILLEMHNTLARETGNPIFVAIIKGLITIANQFVDLSGPLEGMELFEARRRFVGHLRANRPEKAIEEISKTLREANELYVSTLAASAPAVPLAPTAPANTRATVKKPALKKSAVKKRVAKK